ncbi:hypothetical protein [Nocardioides sp.]|uniref:hypothetical protein n=1 Tax=Nocardioides sp. TaxID=35761 RepID=UPI002ED0F363
MSPSLVKLVIVFFLTVLPLLIVAFMVLQVLCGAPRPQAVRPQPVAARKARPSFGIRIAPARQPSLVMASIRRLAVREEPSRQSALQ